jgi:hypothetical protein
MKIPKGSRPPCQTHPAEKKSVSIFLYARLPGRIVVNPVSQGFYGT